MSRGGKRNGSGAKKKIRTVVVSTRVPWFKAKLVRRAIADALGSKQ